VTFREEVNSFTLGVNGLPFCKPSVSEFLGTFLSLLKASTRSRSRSFSVGESRSLRAVSIP
jgi:hypothetical protein